MHPARYTRRDYLAAALTALAVLALAAGILTAGVPRWGDDFAAYLNDGIAIAEGRTDGQYRLNAVMHPTPLPEEARDGKLVYAWGFSLLESLVYRAVGFDRTDYSSVVYYKLILLFSVAALAGVTVLLLRRRFSLRLSVCLSAWFCINPMLLEEINTLYGDLVFLWFTIQTFLLAECFAFARKPAGRIVTGLLYAASMAVTYELRLNGFTVLLMALLGHAVCFIKKQIRFSGREAVRHAAPYILCAGIIIAAERIWLPGATPNTSDLKRAGWDSMVYNAGVIIEKAYLFFDSGTWPRIYVFGAAMWALSLAGMIRRGFREDLYLAVFWLGTVATLLLLPYDQGLRYLLNVLPVMMIFAVYGAGWIWDGLKRRMKRPDAERARRIGWGVAALALCLCAAPRIGDGISRLGGLPEDRPDGVYSAEAKEAYRYIQEHTAEDAEIIFAKPRALYLNTGRTAFRPDRNGHSPEEAEYYLMYKLLDFGMPYEEEAKEYPCVFENAAFALYDMRAGRAEQGNGAP